MLKILVPPFFQPEKKYILEVFFEEFLFIKINIESKRCNEWKIVLPNEKQIHFSDVFFDSCKERDYLSQKYIPGKVALMQNQFIKGESLPVLYGGTKTEVSDSLIKCDADIFASSFFMLTRWEEAVIKDKDKFGRVPDEKQWAVKYNFSHRPIVNEYVEMLRNMLLHFGYPVPEKRKYSLKITHDIDFFEKYPNIKKTVKSISGDLLKRKSSKLALKSVKKLWNIKKGDKKDPFDTFDYLMESSERVGVKSNFYFIPGKMGEDDAHYNITNSRVAAKVSELKSKGHTVGVHASWGSYNNESRFVKELNRLKSIEPNISEGRQHFLRFENPKTWQIWNDAGLKVDSSMSYISRGGFRAGVCYDYSVFNILKRKKLKLKQQPLIAMETALARNKPTPDALLMSFAKLIKQVKLYNGQFVMLWHNSNFNLPEWEHYSAVYEKVLQIAKV